MPSLCSFPSQWLHSMNLKFISKAFPIRFPPVSVLVVLSLSNSMCRVSTAPRVDKMSPVIHLTVNVTIMGQSVAGIPATTNHVSKCFLDWFFTWFKTGCLRDRMSVFAECVHVHTENNNKPKSLPPKMYHLIMLEVLLIHPCGHGNAWPFHWATSQRNVHFST